MSDDETEQSGYPEGDPTGPGDQRGGDEADTGDAPADSSPEESEPDTATGNPGAAG